MMYIRAFAFWIALITLPAVVNADTPTPRWGQVFVYDHARDEILLFGGASDRGRYLDETWTWKNEVWTRHEVPGPPHRGFSGAAFHPAEDRIIIHGGRGNERITHADTWSWNGHRWAQIEKEGNWRVDHHQVVWDGENKQLVGFGGWTGTAVLGETRIWSGEKWIVAATSGPPPRSAFGMAYDPDRKRVVLYGGLWINGQYADTWFWDGSTWVAHTGPYDDSSLDHHSIVWDDNRRELVLFGGKNYRYTLNGRTRFLDGRVWQEKTGEGPQARHSTSLTWHATRKTAMFFGGKYYTSDEQLPLGDLWEWDGKDWQLLDGSADDR